MAIRIAKKPMAGAQTEVPPNPSETTLPLRWRPAALGQVLGQAPIVASLGKLLKTERVPHAFLFTGPSGTGKTTIARIVSRELGVVSAAVQEIDAATNSGIDAMRAVLEKLSYRALSGDGRKFVIVDECHQLSKATWNSLLKAIEEPPPHVYWALCTTEPDKVPETIRTRCTAYHLKPIDSETLEDLLALISRSEKLDTPADLLGMVARHAQGSARKALVFLEQIQGVTDKKEAVRLLETGVGEEAEALNLARMVCTGKGFNWAGARELIAKLEGESPEGVRLIVVNYAAAVLKTTNHPEPLLAVLDAFRGPFNPSEKWAPVYLSIGALLFN